jgi:hypothetical protein
MASLAASVLLGAFSSREIVDCDASGSPVSGQRPTAAFIKGSCKPQAYAKLALGLAQQQQAGIGGLGAAGKIYCEFLALDGWQVEGKRRIVGHGGCGAGLVAQSEATGYRFAI